MPLIASRKSRPAPVTFAVARRAGARLDPKTARDYPEAYKRNLKAVALVKKASGQ